MKINLCEGWQFQKAGAESVTVVDLPHDAMLLEPRDPHGQNGQNTGYFPGGKYIYEKTIEAPDEWLTKSVSVYFEGIYQRSKIYFNDTLIGAHANGYTPFECSLKNLRRGENTLRVEVDNSTEPNSRWYSGSGLYRPVWLKVREADSIDRIRVDTVSIEPAVIRVACEALSGEMVSSEARLAIFEGGVVEPGVAPIYEGLCGLITIPDAKLWSAETPHLYTCKVGEECVRFGIRQLKWSAQSGLCVNGTEVKLRGGCIHHDNGLLGACAFRDAEYRKARLLKEAGFNAVRSAHNLCSEAFLDAADELGLYVMDEAFDQWYIPKNKGDYARDFEANYVEDLTTMARRDYNHPSVILYSIGNEITETAQSRGKDLTREMVSLLHQIDPSRPVTCGINLFLNGLVSKGIGIYQADGEGMASQVKDEDSRMAKLSGSALYNSIMEHLSTIKDIVSLSSMADKATREAYAELDICGYNYGTARYQKDGRKYPERVIVGSETYLSGLYNTWKKVLKKPYLVGDFIWTAWDYLGESGIGAWRYGTVGYNKPYPYLTAGCGCFSITGRPDAMLYLAQASYGERPVLKMATRPMLDKKTRVYTSPWRTTDATECWDFPGHEGEKAFVEVYTTASRVVLYLNGKQIAQKKPRKAVCKFSVPYAPGELTAVAFGDDGTELARTSLYSTQGKKHLEITPEEYDELVYVNIQLVDEKGHPCRNERDDIEITVETQNIALQALGTDKIINSSSYLSNTCKTYQGHAQAILRKKDQTHAQYECKVYARRDGSGAD